MSVVLPTVLVELGGSMAMELKVTLLHKITINEGGSSAESLLLYVRYVHNSFLVPALLDSSRLLVLYYCRL